MAEIFVWECSLSLKNQENDVENGWMRIELICTHVICTICRIVSHFITQISLQL